MPRTLFTHGEREELEPVALPHVDETLRDQSIIEGLEGKGDLEVETIDMADSHDLPSVSSLLPAARRLRTRKTSLAGSLKQLPSTGIKKPQLTSKRLIQLRQSLEGRWKEIEAGSSSRASRSDKGGGWRKSEVEVLDLTTD